MKKIILLLVLLTSFSFVVKSTHIVGGDTRFVQIGPNQYKVFFRLFRDCNPGTATAPTSLSNVRMFDNVTNLVSSTYSFSRDSVETLSFGDACYTPTGLCVEVHYYSGTVTVPNNPNGYYVTWEICCRNNSITNISNPGSQAMVFTCQFPDPTLTGGNANPKFVDYPSDGYFCVSGTRFKYIDFSCTDADSDSLVYSLITPYESTSSTGSRPLSVVPWATSHNLANILGTGSLCSIDPKTGIVKTRPGRLGTYVIAVKCEEFRNGIKIGEVHRDIQLQALNCNFDKPPKFEAFPEVYKLKFDTKECFDIVASDPDTLDNFNIEVLSDAYLYGAVSVLPSQNTSGKYDFYWKDTNTGGIAYANNLNVSKQSATKFTGIGKIGVRFCWEPKQCDILAIDTFKIDLLAYSIGCDASIDTLKRVLKIVIEKEKSDHIVPNVFSPNGDGKNDNFLLKKGAFDRCFDNLTVRIYNRWGQNVYESTDAQFEWDGRDEKGNNLSEGTYYVSIQGYYGGKEVTENFPLTLFR